MNIVVGHLYYDLMNLYGDNGNIKVLKYNLEKQGINVTIKKLSLDDKIDFNKLDMIYMGSGTEENRKIVLNDILKYKNNINKFYKDNKFLLVTGNSLSLFGNYIIDKDGNKKDALKLFNFYTKEEKERDVKEVNVHCTFLKDNLLGFINKQDNMYKNDKILEYGIYKNNFYGTYILGPILARNPEFTQYFITNLIKSKDKDFIFKDFNTSLDEEAYLDYIAFKNS